MLSKYPTKYKNLKEFHKWRIIPLASVPGWKDSCRQDMEGPSSHTSGILVEVSGQRRVSKYIVKMWSQNDQCYRGNSRQAGREGLEGSKDEVAREGPLIRENMPGNTRGGQFQAGRTAGTGSRGCDKLRLCEEQGRVRKKLPGMAENGQEGVQREAGASWGNRDPMRISLPLITRQWVFEK